VWKEANEDVSNPSFFPPLSVGDTLQYQCQEKKIYILNKQLKMVKPRRILRERRESKPEFFFFLF